MGEQQWSGTEVVDQGKVEVDLPTKFLKPLRTYDVRAQFLDTSNNPGVMGPNNRVVVDLVAPTVPAPPCSGTCNSANSVLFDGTIDPDDSETLDLTSLTNTGDGNWPEYVDLRVEAGTSSDATLQFNSGIPLDDVELPPTMVVPSGEAMTVRVVPEDVYSAVVTNAGTSAADLRLTAIGWVPGWGADDEAQEAAIEAEADRLLATDEVVEAWQPPALDPTAVLPQTGCDENTEGPCAAYLPAGLDEGQNLREPKSSGTDQAPRQGMHTLSFDDAPLDCASGSTTGGWVVQDRFTACGVFDANLWLPGIPPTLIQLRIYHRFKTSNRSNTLSYFYKIKMKHTYGPNWGIPIRAGVKVDCSICTNGNISKKTTESVSSLGPARKESAWVEQRIPIATSPTDTSLKTTLLGDVMPKWSFDFPFVPDVGEITYQDVPLRSSPATGVTDASSAPRITVCAAAV